MDKKELILIVDDEDEMRSYIGGLVTSFGYQTSSASNGAEALEKFNAMNPALIIMDLMMPEMDGIEVLGRIKEQNGDTPVIILSGHGDTKNVVRAMKMGGIGFYKQAI